VVDCRIYVVASFVEVEEEVAEVELAEEVFRRRRVECCGISGS
jgi:hypothetical protein